MRFKLISRIKSILSHKNFNSYFQTLLNFLALIVAIIVLLISKKTLDNANLQFEQNSKTADSLFNLQLSYAKNLNDSLISEIGRLQEITGKQLRITDEQLRISIETLNEQIYSGRPKIIVLSDQIKDKENIKDEIFSPNIITTFKNIGKRFAESVSLRPFIVYPDFSQIRGGALPNPHLLEPGTEHIYEFKPRINVKFRDDFYYCYEIVYFDKILKQQFKQVYYRHYYKRRRSFEFFFCKLEEEIRIKRTVNDILKTINESLFDE